MKLFGTTRVRNEGRWIVECLKRMLPICDKIVVWDDGSTDGTPELCEEMGEDVIVIRSPYREPVDQGLNESRDKFAALQRVMGFVSDVRLRGDTYSPYWCLSLDADEWLDPSAYDVIRKTLPQTPHHAFSVPIRFLWDSDVSLINAPGQRRVRIDGVYRRFAEIGRPSIFRLMNRAFGYLSTPFGNGANFHCSSIPQELLAHHVPLAAPCWHLGYQFKDDRVRKWKWYNQIDPNNAAEDFYRHCVQGDIPEVPAATRLLHAGPMMFQMM